VGIETVIHLNKFQPRDYQIPICRALEGYTDLQGVYHKPMKRIMIILPRRAGKDLICFNLMFRQALKRVGTYFYVLPTFSSARRILWDNITIQGQKLLDYIPSELIKRKNEQQMRIEFVNGSVLQLIGSDTYNNTLVGTNPVGIIFSEFGITDERAYHFSKPILSANDGWVIINGCVAPNTIVITKYGPRRISTLSQSREQYSTYNKEIYGLGGFHNATDYYYGGLRNTLKITLSSGYSIEVTPNHPLWDGTKWIKAEDLTLGIMLPIQYGQNIFGEGFDFSGFNPYVGKGVEWRMEHRPQDEDFFYLLGLIHADGSYERDRITITNKKDKEIIDFLHGLGFETQKDGIHHRLCSVELSSFLEWAGFKHGARNKTFPESLFSCNKDQMRWFLQGLFDGDGTSNRDSKHCGSIKITSTCLEFIQDLQRILLNFGIISSITSENKAPTKRVKVWSLIYNLEIRGHFAHKFYEEIGFRIERKQKNSANVPESVKEDSGNIYPIDVSRLSDYKLSWSIRNKTHRMARRLIKKYNDKNPYPYLAELLRENFYYSPITKIEESQCEVFDFVIPETHSFFSNGFISHNTPRGDKNYFYILREIARQNPDEWFWYEKTVDETRHMDIEEIYRDIARGEISYDHARQEYWCDWHIGQQGCIYNDYLNKMRLENRITMVPYETSHPVYTAWDLGVMDKTVILFFQKIGTAIRIIDSYSNTDKGLDHYAKILAEKGYNYGINPIHVAPHDIAHRDIATSGALSRIEIARSLGIRFTIAPRLSVEDGIEAGKILFSRLWIDEEHNKDFISALGEYRREYDIVNKVYRKTPLHNWASDWADAYRYLAISQKIITADNYTPEDLERNFRQSHYPQNNIPLPLQDRY
jgi:intein/homing endonuclease